jgi:pantoate--beta-alanine ligase
VRDLQKPLCGKSRPGHFAGVATVVAKLFHATLPHVAVFGEKDYQQLAIIRRMVRDLDFGIEIASAPIVREPDGLALSSRNAYLSPEERAQAVGLWRALSEVRAQFASGEKDSDVLERVARQVLERHGARVDYAELRDGVELERRARVDDSTRLFLAAFLGKTRLIDNGALGKSG